MTDITASEKKPMTPTEWLLKCWGRPLLQMFSLHSLSQMKVSAEEVM